MKVKISRRREIINPMPGELAITKKDVLGLQETVVLVTDWRFNGFTFSGIVIYSMEEEYIAGTISENWDKKSFEKFSGILEIEQ